MAPNFEYRLPHRRDDAPGHLILIHLVTGMNAGHDDVELLQDPIRIVQRTVLENVRFGALQYFDLSFFLDLFDLFPLSLQAIDFDTPGIEGRR